MLADVSIHRSTNYSISNKTLQNNNYQHNYSIASMGSFEKPNRNSTSTASHNISFLDFISQQ